MIIEMFNFCLCFLCLWLFCKLDQFGFFEVVINKFYSHTLFISIVSFFVSLLRSFLSTSLKSEHVTSTFKYKMLETVLAKLALPWWWVPRLGQSQSWSPLPFYFPWICVTVTVTRSKQHLLMKMKKITTITFLNIRLDYYFDINHVYWNLFSATYNIYMFVECWIIRKSLMMYEIKVNTE